MTIGAIGVYLLEVSVLLILLYIFNKQLLSRETFHRMNRYLWLAVISLSFLLPLVAPHMVASLEALTPILRAEGFDLGEISLVGMVSEEQGSTSHLSLVLFILAVIYTIGFVILLCHNLFSYISLLCLVLDRRYNLAVSKDPDDIKLLKELREYEQQLNIKGSVNYLILDREIAPFSWLNFVVVSRSDLASQSREIITHELSHVAARHSVDVILLNIITTILWFNPAAWLTKRAVQQVHEYCADESVLSLGVDAKQYQLLLIRKTVGERLYTISNSLNHSNLKNRITMMLKKKSSRVAVAKSLYAIPVAICSIALFTSPALAKPIGAVTEVKVTNYFAENKIEVSEVPQSSESELTEQSRTLYYVNGEPTLSIETISSDLIESITVIKSGGSAEWSDHKAWKTYDPQSFDGIIEITLKDSEREQSAQKSGSTTKNADAAYLRAEVMPLFQGGDLASFRDWVMRSVSYPAEDAATGVQGTVNVAFVIEVDGSVVEVESLKTPSDALFEEVKRIILSSSKMWSPAMADGECVKVKYTLPIIFKLSSEA